uniref:Uncharacterized protein n=1 Tax=Percolomonas cosmopolitus TaxID=63605 RepID=A0A7S1KTA9_9EUKA
MSSSTLSLYFSKCIPKHISAPLQHCLAITKNQTMPVVGLPPFLKVASTLEDASILLIRYDDDDSHGELLKSSQLGIRILPLQFFQWVCAQKMDCEAARVDNIRCIAEMLVDQEIFRRWAMWGDAMSGGGCIERNATSEGCSFHSLLESSHLFGEILESARELEEIPHTVPDFIAQEDRLVPKDEKRTVYILFLEREKTDARRKSSTATRRIPKEEIVQFMEAFFYGLQVKWHPEAEEFHLAEQREHKNNQHGVVHKSHGIFYPIDMRQDKIKCRDVDSGKWRAHRATRLQVMDLISVFEEHVPNDAFALLVVTPEDIYETESASDSTTGRATGDGVAVISTYRFNPLQNASIDLRHLQTEAEISRITVREFLKTLAHECCHIFGLDHCTFHRCLMNACLVENLDANSFHLCPIDLRKLHVSIGFDVRTRYEVLKTFFSDMGMSKEMKFVESLLKVIEIGNEID